MHLVEVNSVFFVSVFLASICPFSFDMSFVSVSESVYHGISRYTTVYHGIQLVNCLHTISIDIVIVVVIVFCSHQKILVAPSEKSF